MSFLSDLSLNWESCERRAGSCRKHRWKVDVS